MDTVQSAITDPIRFGNKSVVDQYDWEDKRETRVVLEIESDKHSR